MLDASITENIALTSRRARIERDRVQQATHEAQIAEGIESHRQSYDTRIGEHGVQLSGGQRWHIGIARDFFKNADVLVLDQASSALDMAAEAPVTDAVNEFDPSLTIDVIVQREKMLRQCDMVPRLEDNFLILYGKYSEVVEV